MHLNDCEKNTSKAKYYLLYKIIHFANIPFIFAPHNFKIINFWNKFLILSNRWTQTDREKEKSLHTPTRKGFLLGGSTAVFRETTPSCFWIRIFIHGTVISTHVSSLKSKQVSRLSMHTVFLDWWMHHIFFKIHWKHVWSSRPISFHTVNCILQRKSP